MWLTGVWVTFSLSNSYVFFLFSSVTLYCNVGWHCIWRQERLFSLTNCSIPSLSGNKSSRMSDWWDSCCPFFLSDTNFVKPVIRRTDVQERKTRDEFCGKFVSAARAFESPIQRIWRTNLTSCWGLLSHQQQSPRFLRSRFFSGCHYLYLFISKDSIIESLSVGEKGCVSLPETFLTYDYKCNVKPRCSLMPCYWDSGAKNVSY